MGQQLSAISEVLGTDADAGGVDQAYDKFSLHSIASASQYIIIYYTIIPHYALAIKLNGKNIMVPMRKTK